MSPLPTQNLGEGVLSPEKNENLLDINSNLSPADEVQSAPHIYYMNANGIAEPAENSRKALIIRKRDVESVKLPSNEGDEEIVQSDGGTYAVETDKLGYRPARAYYARRYHKYPWNYH